LQTRQTWEEEIAEKRAEDPLWGGTYQLSDDDMLDALLEALREDVIFRRKHDLEVRGAVVAADVARVLSPDHALEHASSVGGRLFSLEREERVASLRLPPDPRTYWLPADQMDSLPEATRKQMVLRPTPDVLGSPAHPVTPRDVLVALIAAVDASSEPLAQYRDVWRLVGENKASKAEVSYRLARLRRYGLARWEVQEGVRLWGLTKKSRAALRKKTA
jgi:hypothetical protein